jgi:multimeric flavodoxin WrbA
MMILGISGSPKVGGNTDSMVKAVLEKSGAETHFINLSRLRFDPCRGCCHLCASTNKCGVKDDLIPCLELVREADALVLGTPFQVGMPTGFMYSFLTRLMCFHHVDLVLHNKPAILVSAGVKPIELQQNEGIYGFEKMVEHSKQIKSYGHIYFNSASPPCLRCGEGERCYNGGLYKYVLNKDKNRLRDFNVSTEMIQNWEDCPQTVDKVSRYGKVLKEL